METTYYKGVEYIHADYDTNEKRKKLPKEVRDIIVKNDNSGTTANDTSTDSIE